MKTHARHAPNTHTNTHLHPLARLHALHHESRDHINDLHDRDLYGLNKEIMVERYRKENCL